MFGVIEGLKAKKKGKRNTFGFIQGEDMNSYFFIPPGLQRTTIPFEGLKEGFAVEFTPIQHPRGPRAIEIRVLGAGERNE